MTRDENNDNKYGYRYGFTVVAVYIWTKATLSTLIMVRAFSWMENHWSNWWWTDNRLRRRIIHYTRNKLYYSDTRKIAYHYNCYSLTQLINTIICTNYVFFFNLFQVSKENTILSMKIVSKICYTNNSYGPLNLLFLNYIKSWKNKLCYQYRSCAFWNFKLPEIIIEI